MDFKKLKINKDTQLSIVLFLFRISLGWTFLRAFIDKAFGVSRGWDSAWFNGASPTAGYLGGASGAFSWMAGSGIVDFLFMFGLLGLGVGLFVGAGRNLTTGGGVTLMLLMWFAKIPVPGEGVTFWSDAKAFLLVDHHIVNALVFLLIFYLAAQDKISLDKWWKSRSFVKDRKWLQ